MNYQFYKFHFLTAVHLGTGTLDSTGCVFSSDTLFSALCQEAVKSGVEQLETLVTMARNNRIRFSDGLPFIQDEYYLPKPVLYLGKREDEGNSTTKKAYKNLKFIAASQFDQYLQGKLPLERTHDMKNLGQEEMKVSANTRSGDRVLFNRDGSDRDAGDTLPYRISIFRYNKGNGLYLVVGYEDEQDLNFVEDLLLRLSYSGIGGRRSSGLGRFELQMGKSSSALIQALDHQNAEYQMLISQALPAENELADAMDQATYTLVRRSGFVSSPNYSDEFRRKRDLYVFAGGSVFHRRFSGDVYDVSEGGNHPVYRYAKPLFIGLNLEVARS